MSKTILSLALSGLLLALGLCADAQQAKEDRTDRYFNWSIIFGCFVPNIGI